MMRRVFTNLVTNALQAMPEGGQLTITASQPEEVVLISVQDTGVGIPEEDLPKLFHPLYTTKAKGVGLGLAVCQRLVEAHGGSITVESQVGRGSTFTVKLPVRREMS
jgi:signal transduction histidine kinase